MRRRPKLLKLKGHKKQIGNYLKWYRWNISLKIIGGQEDLLKCNFNKLLVKPVNFCRQKTKQNYWIRIHKLLFTQHHFKHPYMEMSKPMAHLLMNSLF